MITAEGITKSYVRKSGRKTIFRDLSFEVPRGENLAILGGAGTGKTSLINMIGGIDFPDRGRIRRHGSISWPFGQMRYERGMTVSQHIRFLCRVVGEKDFARVEREVRELTGYSREFLHPASELNQPDTRRLSLALSLAFSFDIMLFDGKPLFNQVENGEAYEAKLEEKLKQSAAVIATKAPQQVDASYKYFLVLDGSSGQLYDKRKVAVEAYRGINKDIVAEEAGVEPADEEQDKAWGLS
ncbi:ATP-binding cassette domain-containing protein [Kordiimonas gwangyangensis]|uniref:ATP-binding cassette domain-containing protein n=1 Tax=Kordiimonas gwangyangensis TaxID=288022 RepID=UPI00036A2041|nr:ATP-binding cassette domain-containing protein [Kordiimonas gwangyangensis]